MSDSDRIAQVERALREFETRMSVLGAEISGMNARLENTNKVLQLEAENRKIREELANLEQKRSKLAVALLNILASLRRMIGMKARLSAEEAVMACALLELSRDKFDMLISIPAVKRMWDERQEKNIANHLGDHN